MAKLIVEENIKSKHPDSFKILKSHGYNLLRSMYGKESNETYRHSSTSHKVALSPDGTWKLGHSNQVLAVGKSHSDLKVHLDKIHK